MTTDRAVFCIESSSSDIKQCSYDEAISKTGKKQYLFEDEFNKLSSN